MGANNGAKYLKMIFVLFMYPSFKIFI